jgi:hypothetical protein
MRDPYFVVQEQMKDITPASRVSYQARVEVDFTGECRDGDQGGAANRQDGSHSLRAGTVHKQVNNSSFVDHKQWQLHVQRRAS